MDLFSPSGHRDALESHSLNLIQSMFVALGGKGMEEKGTDPFCLRQINNSVKEKGNPFNQMRTRNTFSSNEQKQ